MALHRKSFKQYHRLLAFLHDLIAIPCAFFLAYWLRFNLGIIPSEILQQAIFLLPFIMLVQASAYFFFGLYRGIWRFTSMRDLIRIIKAVIAGTIAIILAIALFSRLNNVPRSIFPLYTLLLICLLAGSRLLFRWLKHYYVDFSDAKRVLIVGAGQAGEGLIRDLLRDVTRKYVPVAVVDDNPHRLGREIHGIRVLGDISQIVEIAKQCSIDLIFIAVPSASSTSMRKIVAQCEATTLPFRTLPGLQNLADGHININLLREVSIEDLLGRETVSLDWELINLRLNKKTVLISGGGGSIGSELTRQLAKLQLQALIVIESSEFNLYSLELELRQKFQNLPLFTHLVDVTDQTAVQHILSKYKPDIVFHAAAYKHVPILETQLRVAIRNNILGTWILAQESVAQQVKQFTLISTDKAVNPTNIMGASKRAAEVICQNFNWQANTQFFTVRFGNVLDSAGSVVPLFRKQIAAGGPVTVTHPDITRFFMTIPEASQLILQATSMGHGGEIFVLDMGEPIKIKYLAQQMIQLAGLKIEEDIQIVYTGLRPGEKLYEELFHQNEPLVRTAHEKILQASPRAFDWQALSEILHQMQSACVAFDEGQLKILLKKLVPEWCSEDGGQKTEDRLQTVADGR